MRPRRLAAVAGGLLGVLLAGCAALPPRTPALTATVAPGTIYPGDVVTIRVTAPAGSRNVRGRLDLPGSPVLPLRSRDGGQTWVFTTQIPVDAIWQPGRYKVVVEGEAPDGSDLYGETWITAP